MLTLTTILKKVMRRVNETPLSETLCVTSTVYIVSDNDWLVFN